MRRRANVLVSTVAVAGVFTACGTTPSSGDPIPAPASSSSGQTPTSPTPSDSGDPVSDPTDPTTVATDGAPPFPTNTSAQVAKHSGSWHLVFTDVRVAQRKGHDRIVLEFAGTGRPGWSVNYVDQAVLDGSGDVVALRGEATLDIYASGTTWPAPGYYSGPRRFRPGTGGVVEDVHVGGTFEGYTQVLVALDGDPAPFRVFALTHPSRLVVDVLDDKTG